MKIFFRRIHLYLSLAAGLAILIACLTGAILVFEKDLQMAFNKDRYYVDPDANRLPLDSLKALAVSTFPGHKVNGIKVYADAERSVELQVAPGKKGGDKEGKKQEATPSGKDQKEGKASSDAKGAKGKEVKGAGGPPPGFTVFMNPYTGAVLEKYSYRDTFWFQVMALHRWLLGGNNSVGKLIMGVSTFIFLFILITGIILWWPKTQKILVQRLRIKNSAGWKRLNHDLHIVLGFYSAIFLFIFAFTALAWSFEWFNKGIYTVTKSTMKSPEPPKSIVTEGAAAISFDQALAAAQTVYPKAAFYNLSAPKDATEAFQVSALSLQPAHENATDAIYVDQYSGNVLGQLAFADRNLGAKTRSFFKPVHTGSIWGTPSKIIAFIVCLLGTSFPITGIIMWWNRTRKKAPVRRRQAEMVS